MKETGICTVVICATFLIVGGGVAVPAQAQDRTTGVERGRLDMSAETAGEAAERSGQYSDAFYAYVSAYRSLPEPLSPADDKRLRTRIIEVVSKLGTRPPISPDASAHYANASTLLDAELILGSAGAKSTEAVVKELTMAVRLAPWWPEATFKLAAALQELGRVDEALLNLTLYRLADPEGYSAAIVAKRGAQDANAAANGAQTGSPAPTPTGTIYVYWPAQARNAGGQVQCDGSNVADLQEGRFVVVYASPGVHALRLGSARVSISVESNETYYLRGSTEGFPAGTRVRQIDADLAIAEMLKGQMTTNDERKTFRYECSAANGSKPGSRSR